MHSAVALVGEEASCTRKQGLAVGANRLKGEKSFAGSRQQKNGNKGQVMPSLMLLQQQQQMNSLLTSECNSSLSSSPDAINSSSNGGGNIKVNKTKKPPNDCKLVGGGGGGGGAGRRCYNQKNGLNGRRQKNGDEKEAAGSHCVGKLPAKISKWAKPNRGIGRRIKKNNSRLKVKLKLQTPNHSLPGSTNDFRFINSTINTTNYDSNYNNTNINNIINNNNNNGNINNNNSHINKNISKNRNITNNNNNNNYSSSGRSNTAINPSKSITATKTLTTTTMPVSSTTTTTTTTVTTNNSSKPPSHKKRLRVNKMQSIFDVIHVLREDVVADRCIGVQAGELLTNLYIDRDSKCIKCTTCTELFSIVHFMQHHQHSNSGVSCHSDLPVSASPLSQQQQKHQHQQQQQQQQQLSSPFLSSSSSLSTPPTSLPPSLPTPDTVRELSSTPCMWRLKLNSNTSESQQKLWKHFLKKQHQLQSRQQSPPKSGNGIRFYTSANMLLLESQPSNLKQGGTSANSSTSRVSSRKRKQKQFYPIENYEFKTALSSAAHSRNSAGTISSEQSSRHYGGAVVKSPVGAASGRAMSCSMGLSPSKKTMKLSHQPCEGAAMSVSSAPGSAKAVILPGVSGSSAFSTPQQTLNPTATTAHKKNRNNKSNHTTTNKSNNTTTNRNNNNNNTATNKNNTTTSKNNSTTTTTNNNNSSSSSLSENVVTLKNEPELLNFTALQTDDYDM
ncbi:serine-rich adhesin for platelets-like [Octopus vulgaris]|uniref:Serine-rich adhesin for platelets-like n=1 Tax=Octopus vulgaris TaxID=6645 RepID=A0AA36BEE5_OCTVU|nr:serine-rich adhesin for platelets-like [Octopus vulgaris]